MRETIRDKNYVGKHGTEEISFAFEDIAITRTIKKTKGGGPWIFKIEEDVSVETDITGITFASRWLAITPEGRMTVSAGYAWDGNSKKINVFDLFVIGTPDGIIDVRTMKPKTWYASLVHDALYQYFGYHGIARKEMDELYRLLAREARFAPTPIYHAVIRILGGLFFLGKKKIALSRTGRTLVFFREFLGRDQANA